MTQNFFGDYETIIALSAIMFCWVSLPIMYYLGYRDGKRAGFLRGLPFGALAWILAKKEKEDDGSKVLLQPGKSDRLSAD